MNEENTSTIERSIGKLEGKMDMMVSSMNALSASFDSLEKGRLSRLEINFAELNTNVQDKAKNTALWTSGIVTLIVSTVIALVIHFFHL